MKTDAQLLADVRAELEWDTGVDNSDIIVAVADSTVTLAGHVGSWLDRLNAERAVKRVAGVRAIANEIDVQLGVSTRYSDKEIAHAAAIALQSSAATPATVQAIVSDGSITLEGHVDFHYQKEAADLAVCGLRGVKGVKNSISVGSHSTAHHLHDQIMAALGRHALVNAAAVDVSIADGVVTLAGEVRSWHERDAAERVACSAPGVRSVVNNLHIRPA